MHNSGQWDSIKCTLEWLMERIHCIRIYTNLNKEDNFYVSDLLSYFTLNIPDCSGI